MKMHLLVCTLAMLFTQRCCNMIVQTVGLEWHSHGLPTSCSLIYFIAKYFDFCVNGGQSILIIRCILVPYIFLCLKLILFKL
jgi:hypothetical protein